MSNVKWCPLLLQRKENKAMMRGQGDTEIIYMLPCIKEKCAAYVIDRDNIGHCTHYGTIIDRKTGELEYDDN